MRCLFAYLHNITNYFEISDIVSCVRGASSLLKSKVLCRSCYDCTSRKCFESANNVVAYFFSTELLSCGWNWQIIVDAI